MSTTTKVAPVAPITPRVVGVALNPTAPLATVSPVAVLATTAPASTKKPFEQTTFGQIFTSSGGLAGLASAAASIAGMVNGTPAATGIDPATGQPVTPSVADDDEPLTVLGLPPFAFAAVLLLVLVGVAVLVHKSRSA